MNRLGKTRTAPKAYRFRARAVPKSTHTHVPVAPTRAFKLRRAKHEEDIRFVPKAKANTRKFRARPVPPTTYKAHPISPKHEERALQVAREKKKRLGIESQKMHQRTHIPKTTVGSASQPKKSKPFPGAPHQKHIEPKQAERSEEGMEIARAEEKETLLESETEKTPARKDSDERGPTQGPEAEEKDANDESATMEADRNKQSQAWIGSPVATCTDEMLTEAVSSWEETTLARLAAEEQPEEDTISVSKESIKATTNEENSGSESETPVFERANPTVTPEKPQNEEPGGASTATLEKSLDKTLETTAAATPEMPQADQKRPGEEPDGVSSVALEKHETELENLVKELDTEEPESLGKGLETVAVTPEKLQAELEHTGEEPDAALEKPRTESESLDREPKTPAAVTPEKLQPELKHLGKESDGTSTAALENSRPELEGLGKEELSYVIPAKKINVGDSDQIGAKRVSAIPPPRSLGRGVPSKMRKTLLLTVTPPGAPNRFGFSSSLIFHTPPRRGKLPVPITFSPKSDTSATEHPEHVPKTSYKNRVGFCFEAHPRPPMSSRPKRREQLVSPAISKVRPVVSPEPTTPKPLKARPYPATTYSQKSISPPGNKKRPPRSKNVCI